MSDKFLIEKRGLYYRPEARGYTGLKREAGRYSFEEAAERVGPNGPEVPQDGLGMWREDEAPDCSSACPRDVRLMEKVRKESADEIEALAAERDRLREALTSVMALQDNTSPFGGELQADRIERTLDRARAALKEQDQ